MLRRVPEQRRRGRAGLHRPGGPPLNLTVAPSQVDPIRVVWAEVP